MSFFKWLFKWLSEIRQPKPDRLIEQIEDDEMGFFLTQTSKGKVIRVTGRLDSVTSPQLESHVSRHLEDNDKQKIVFDFRGLGFISSAGLRVCVKTHQKADMTVVMTKSSDNPIYRVFEISGIALTLNIEESIESAL